MKTLKKLKSLLSDSTRTLKERVFIMLTFIAIGMVGIALLGDIIYKDNIVEIIVLIVTLLAVPVFTYFGVKTKHVDLATGLISLGVVLFVMPVIFFFGGGYSGAAVPWMVFTFMYMGLLLYGVWRVVMIFVLTAVVAALYYIGYTYPELVYIQPKEILVIDAFLAVVEVGFVCFIMTWFQNMLFITENLRAKEETKKVEELNNAQNRFFSSMSHEIRTPINSILGLNELILRQSDASDEIKRDARNIQGAGRMLLAIINDILDFSKIEAGKMDIVPVSYSMESLISEIVNMIWLRAEQKGLKLRIEIDPSIPSELFGDEVRIKQILVNILNNAVKYTNEGSVTLHIEKESVQGDMVALNYSVTDTGMGIKQDQLPFLFDAFKRVEEQKNAKIEGTGLGLSIVKQLVDLMGGKVTVNSVYTQGSTFIVTLWQKVTRFDPVGNIDINTLESTKGTNSYTPGFKAPDAKILIVDDNEMNLEVERKLLDGTEIVVDTARSGQEALEKTSVGSYDIIFMDHLMPEMDGIECMQRIRKQSAGLNNRVPIIVLTANAGSENKELYARSGFEDYLVKPVSGRQLEEMVLAHIAESKVIVTRETDISKLSVSTARGYRRRIPVAITAGTIIDLPRRVIKRYQIECIPFLIRGEGREYFDGIEAQTDELMRYMKAGQEYESDPPSVEEYERFFAKELKKALNVIYISSAGSISEEYGRAKEAAKAYGNVIVFDSGVGSSAHGIVVLLAQRMASRGDSPERIIEELERIKPYIHCSFVTDGALYMKKKDKYSKWLADIMKTFSIKQIIRCKQSVYSLLQVGMGEIEDVYKKYIDNALPVRGKPDTDVIFVLYTELDEKQKENIRTRILLRHPFEHIIFQKTSAVMALNVGEGAIGLAFFEKEDPAFKIGTMLEEEEPEEIEDSLFADEDNNENKVSEVSEPSWYDGIEGIDGKMAIQNSGSEEVFRTVLKIFYDSLEDKISEMKELLETKDIENYTIKVHALKSSAKLVGAVKLSDDALALENAGKEGNISYIAEHNDEVIEELKRYQEVLSECFEDDQYNALIVESLFDALKEGIKDKDEEYIRNILKEASECKLPQTVAEKLNRIAELLETKSFEEIKNILEDDKTH